MTKPTGRPRGRPKTEEYETLSARVHLELVERVRRYAALKQQPMSVVLRDALEMLLEEERYSPFVSDMNRGTAVPSDRTGDAGASPVPAIMSDTNGETHAPEPHTSAIMSDTKEDYDPTKYFLGELCKPAHDYHGTGKALRRRKGGKCLACEAENSKALRDRQRQRATAGEGLVHKTRFA